MKKINSEVAEFFVPAMAVLGSVFIVAATLYMFIQGKGEGSAMFLSFGVGLLLGSAVLKWVDGKFFS